MPRDSSKCSLLETKKKKKKKTQKQQQNQKKENNNEYIKFISKSKRCSSFPQGSLFCLKDHSYMYFYDLKFLLRRVITVGTSYI